MAFLYIILGFVLLLISVLLLKQRSEMQVNERLIALKKEQIEDINNKLDQVTEQLNKVDGIVVKTHDVSSKLLGFQHSVKS